jgi:hypothetical protein
VTSAEGTDATLVSPAATATPTQPVLVDSDVAPVVALPGGTLVLSYTVFSPNTQDVSLGAGLRVSACADFFYDPPHDRTLTVPAGTSVVTRTFSLPNTSNVTYDVSWGLWSAGFVTSYGLRVSNAAVSVAGPTATPGVPSLLDVDLDPATAYRGSAVVLTYTLYSPNSQQVGLGADMAPEGTPNFASDPPNDRIVNVVAGTSVVTRSFNLGTRSPGYYTVRWGLWNSTFTGQYDLRQRPGILNIWEMGTGTPLESPTPRATSTRTATNSPCNTPVPPTATFTFSATPTTSLTPTNSPTDAPTDTRTNTPTAVATNTPVSTPTPGDGATLVGHVTWQGRPAQPNALQQVAITLTLKAGSAEANYPPQGTDTSGHFTATLNGLPAGTYNWRVKNPRYLANSGSVILGDAGVVSVEMGLLRAGDCNNDNIVSVLDFNTLKNTFGKSQNDPGYDDRADFTGDHAVTVSDFNVQKNNFGQVGSPPE